MDKVNKGSLFGNLTMMDNCRFQDVLYLVFISRQKFSVGATAQKMGIHRDTLYRYINGTLPFPIDRLGDLVRATEWKGWLQYFATGTQLEVGKKLEPFAERVIKELGLALTNYSKAKSGDTSIC